MEEMPPLKSQDLGDLEVGDRIEAWVGGALHHEGFVDLIAPQLSILWIRDAEHFSRLLLDSRDYTLVRC